jgi:hypothetical protein
VLGILRRVFSFSDWTQHHPNEPPPGDMLDASFDAQNERISELEQLILKVLREDGALHNEIVTLDSLAPDFLAKFDEILKESVKQTALKVTIPAENAIRAGDNALRDAERAAASASRAQIAADEVSGARSTALIEVRRLVVEGETLSAAIRDASAKMADTLDDWDDASGEAQAWAESSRLWAEHMPDTLPDNALKVMDVTGDHWSAKWWSNRADNAFGMLTDLYMGVHEDPPATDMTGGPLTPGAIYYDSSKNQTYIWDGSQWVSLAMPQRAGMMTLWYEATAGQTAFNLAVPDEQGLTYIMSVETPEGLDVHRQGLKLVPEGDWTVNPAANTVTLLAPCTAGDIVAIDVMVPVERLGPGAVENWLLKPLVGQDGTNTVFALECAAGGAPPVTIQRNEELIVSVDGVIQQPTAMYSATGNEITFITAPAADAVVFITWFRPDVGSGLATSMSGEEILAALDPVDGAGSGLDADKLDGQHAAYFAVAADLAAETASRTAADAALDAVKANLNSPTFVGTVIVPTYAPPTASGNVASTAFVANAISTANTNQDARDDAQDVTIGNKVNRAGDTMAGKLNALASASGGAGFGLGSGAAPSAPIDGDIWVTTAGFGVRFNGTSYSAAMLNGSSTFTGTKTFNVPPVMATPAAGQASLRLPPGVDPSAPANGDLWGTSGGLFARVNGVTYNLTNTFPEAPIDGQQYARQNAAWAAINVPPGTIISDTAPGSPEPGQLWWESDSGRLLIWYVDPGGAPGQWVQVNAPATVVNEPSDPGIGDAPSDGAEYVRVNGVWRLKRQSFTAITNGINITVPAGAQIAKFSGKLWAATAVNTAAIMRLSADGSTFLSGASDYVVSGSNFFGGSNPSPVKQGHTTTSAWTLAPTTSQVGAPLMFDGQLIVAKNNSGQLFGFQNKGWTFENNATLYMYGYDWNGYTGVAALNAINNLPAFQIIPIGGGTFAAGSMISVEWIY